MTSGNRKQVNGSDNTRSRAAIIWNHHYSVGHRDLLSVLASLAPRIIVLNSFNSAIYDTNQASHAIRLILSYITLKMSYTPLKGRPDPDYYQTIDMQGEKSCLPTHVGSF